MATLFNTRISDTYPGLIKTTDNAAISATLRQLSDGSGNLTGLYLNNAGDFKVTAILEFGSLKDTAENITITKFVDAADGIANNDNDTSIPTSAAIVSYVAAQITAEDLDFRGDDSSVLGDVDLNSEAFIILGTANEIQTTVTAAGGNTIQIGLPNNVTITSDLSAVNLNASSLLTTLDMRLKGSINVLNKAGNNYQAFAQRDVSGSTAVINLNNIGAIGASGTITAPTFSGQLSGTISSATTATTQSAGDNSTKVATTAYVDTLDAASDLDFSGDSGTGDVTLNTETFAISGTTSQIETTASGTGLNIKFPNAGVVLPNGSTATTQADSDDSTKVATTAFVKSLNNASDLDFSGDSGTGDVTLNTQTFSVIGTTNEVETTASNQQLQIGLPSSISVNSASATALQTARDISLTGQATATISSFDGSSNVSGAVTLDNNSVTGKVLTGLASPTASNILASDSILQAFGKTQSQLNTLAGGLRFMGTWNATTNTPTLASGGGEADSGTTTGTATNKLIQSGQNFTSTVTNGDQVVNQASGATALVTNVDSNTQLTLDADIMVSGQEYTIDNSPFISQGHYFVVSVGGTQSLNGLSNWAVGDWVIAGAGNVWEKLDHTQIDGTGTAGNIAKFSSTNVIADSIMAESGSTITVTGQLTTTQELTSGGDFEISKANPSMKFNDLSGGGLDPILTATGSNFTISTSSITPLTIDLSTGAITMMNNLDGVGNLFLGEYIYHSGDGDTFFGFPAANEFKVTAGGSTKFFADSNAAYLYYQGSAKLNTTAHGVAIRNDQGASDNAVLRLRGQNTTNRITRLQFEDYSGTLADGLIQFRIPTSGDASSAVLELGVNSVGVTLDSSNKVGIGTGDPQALLNLSQANGANIRFDNPTTSKYFTIGEGVGTDGVFSFRGNSYQSTDTMSVDFVNNRVGVGVIDPDYTLHVYKAAGDTEVYVNGQNGQSSIRMGLDARNWQIKTAAAPYLWSLNYVGTDVPLSNIITAKVSGQVGFGTDSPTGKVEIQHPQQTTQFDRDCFLRLHPSAHTDSGGFTNMFFGTSTTNNYGVAIGGLRAGANDSPSFSIRMLDDSITGTEAMRILPNADFCIGNTVVNPASGFASQKGIGYDISDGQTQMASTADVSTLVLGRNNATDGSILEFRKESTVVGSFGSNTTGGQVLLDLKANKNFRLVTNNTEVIRVDSSQRVGIGTQNPQNKLVVANGTDNNQNIEIAPNYIQSFNRQSGNLGYATLDFYASSYTFNTGNVAIANDLNLTGTNKKINISGLADGNTFLQVTQTGNETWLFKCQSGSGNQDYVTINASGGTGKIGFGESANLLLDSESTSSDTEELNKIIFRKMHPAGSGSGFYDQASIRAKTYGGYSGGLNFYTNRSLGAGSYGERLTMILDNKQQVGIGVDSLPTDVYTASGGGYAVLGMGQSSFLTAYKTDDSIELCQNTYLNTSGANRGITASVAAGRLTLVDGSMVYQTLQTAADKSQTAQNVLNISAAGLVQISSNNTNQASHEQTFAIKRGLSAAGTVVPIAFVDHTHALDITVIVKQDTSNVATGKGHSVCSYGTANTGMTTVSGSGNVSGITLAYLNTNPSGQDYVLTLTWAGSGASPDAYITIRGNSTSVITEY